MDLAPRIAAWLGVVRLNPADRPAPSSHDAMCHADVTLRHPPSRKAWIATRDGVLSVGCLYRYIVNKYGTHVCAQGEGVGGHRHKDPPHTLAIAAGQPPPKSRWSPQLLRNQRQSITSLSNL